MKYLLLILYIGLLLLIFFGLPDKVLYSQEAIRWTPFILIFFVQTFLLYQLLKSFNVRPKYDASFCALSVLVIGPSFGLYLGQKEEKEFQENGETVKGIVYKKWYTTGKNSEWLLRCQYVVDGVTYSTFSTTDKNNKYRIGDTLTVIYIDNFPQKCTIKELN
ncbi:MAG: hypothetical protein IPN94_15730 [Sphingobacteriales bacterium]|nr:hypothetical protein [Sphingobacteriales bacterium]